MGRRIKHGIQAGTNTHRQQAIPAGNQNPGGMKRTVNDTQTGEQSEKRPTTRIDSLPYDFLALFLERLRKQDELRILTTSVLYSDLCLLGGDGGLADVAHLIPVCIKQVCAVNLPTMVLVAGPGVVKCTVPDRCRSADRLDLRAATDSKCGHGYLLLLRDAVDLTQVGVVAIEAPLMFFMATLTRRYGEKPRGSGNIFLPPTLSWHHHAGADKGNTHQSGGEQTSSR